MAQLDGKYNYIQSSMIKSGIQLFHYVEDEMFDCIELSHKDTVLVEPVEISKYQTIGDFLVELPTIPKMVGKVLKSTIDNLKEGDIILYANNYIKFKYFISVNEKERMKFIIHNDDIIMDKVF